MKVFKKIFAIALCSILIASAFAGCSKSGEADKITDKTMLIAYTDEVEPFLYKDKNGKLAGFDIDLFKKIYDNVKNDTKNYKFVKVDKDYKVGDDVAYTNKDGDEFIAYTMIGAVQKNVGSVNEDFSFTNDINSTIKNNNKNTLYPTIEDALSALDNGSVDAVITDEFNFSPLENAEKYQVLNGELDKISYAFMFKKGDWVVENWNEAIYELKSPDYNDKDEFTPMVEKYFGYNASSFDYVPSKTK